MGTTYRYLLICFGVLCAALTLGQSCGAPATPAPSPSTNNQPAATPRVTACGLIGNNCEVQTGNQPQWVAAADLDADGDTDLAVANSGGDSISILLNNGTGGFTLKNNIAAGDTPNSIVAADFNHDGRPDLVIGNVDLVGGPGVTVFLNQGQASFLAGTSYPTGQVSAMLTTADLDRDGNPDVIVADPFDNSLALLLGGGTGILGNPSYLAAGKHPNSVAAADLNGDGNADLAIAVGQENAALILRNNGSAAFTVSFKLPVGQRPQSIAAGDFNGDGRMDLVTANDGEQEANDSVSVLLNIGNGNFGAAATFFGGVNPRFVTAADLNGDNLPDLAIANQGTGIGDSGVAIFLNQGNGTFGDGILFTAGDGPASLVVADLDGDGDPDLAVADPFGNRLILLGNDGTGFFSASE